MKKKCIVSGALILAMLFFAGCATTAAQPAVVESNTIYNPTIGWNGYTFKIPQELVKKDFFSYSSRKGKNAEALAARVIKRCWNERVKTSDWVWERFGEAFSFADAEGKTCFLLTAQALVLAYPAPNFCQMLSSEKQSLYSFVVRQWYYDLEKVQPTKVGGHQALYVYGTAFEKNGRIYKAKGPGRRPIAYASCVFLGDTRDAYIIIGFADPENAALLKRNMESMKSGFSFL